MRRLFLVLLMILLFPIISLAGWEHDGTGYRYKNDDQSYKTGWYQDTDGRWYYLDISTGYMLKNTSTPDGFMVSESGEWIKDDTATNAVKTYDNTAIFDVTAYTSYGSDTPKQFEQSIPVTVHYDNVYEHIYLNKYQVKFEILNVEVSKDGVLYVNYSAKDDNYYAELKSTTNYRLEDGSDINEHRLLGSWGVNKDGIASKPVMEFVNKKSAPQYISADIYIDLVEEE